MGYKNIYFIVILFLFIFSSDLFATKHIKLQMGNAKKDTSEFLMKKFKEGTDFYATGNEPSWSLDIATNQFIRFNTLNGISIKLGSVNGEKAMDANVTRFVSPSPEGFFTATISQNECYDNMSGDTFSYKVIVELNNQGDKEYKKFEGCGRYVPNYKLNRKWILQKIGDKEIAAGDTMRRIPELQFDAEAMRFGGNAGCNRVSGSLFIEYSKIRFLNPASTMMMCENMELEKDFLDALSKTTDFKILGNQLLLSNPDAMLMTFYDPDAELKERGTMNNDTTNSYVLNDIWIIETLNDNPVAQTVGKDKVPQIEIHLDEMKFFGNGGCNNIFGKLKVYGSKINFSEIGSTRMMCQNSIEPDFLTALKNTDSWKIENNRLYLIQDGKTIIVFKKNYD